MGRKDTAKSGCSGRVQPADAVKTCKNARPVFPFHIQPFINATMPAKT